MRKLTPDARTLSGQEQLEALMAGPGASALGVLLGMRFSGVAALDPRAAVGHRTGWPIVGGGGASHAKLISHVPEGLWQ